MRSMKLQQQADVADLVDIEGQAQDSLALTSTGADTDALDAGIYDLWCDLDVYLKVHATDASDVTTSTGYLMRSGNTITVKIRPDSKIGGVLGSGTGTLYFHKIG